jgi:hypothetical protein
MKASLQGGAEVSKQEQLALSMNEIDCDSRGRMALRDNA